MVTRCGLQRILKSRLLRFDSKFHLVKLSANTFVLVIVYYTTTRMNRRRFLARSCVLLGTVSGCSAFGQEDPPAVTIPELWVENKDDVGHHVDILLLYDDKPVFLESLDVEAATYDGDSLQAPGGRAWKDVATEQRSYTLHARIDREGWFSTQFERFGSDCVRLQVEITREGDGVFGYAACYENTTSE